MPIIPNYYRVLTHPRARREEISFIIYITNNITALFIAIPSYTQDYNHHFFFFFFPLPFPFLDPTYFSIFMISFCRWSYCFCNNYCHSSSNCSFFVFIFNSIAYARNFFVCLFSIKTPEISYYLLILFLSMNYMYLSLSCYCLFLTN